MSKKYKDKPRESKKEKIIRNQVPVPVNCAHPCSYGFARAYCDPCYLDILRDYRKSKQGISN